MKIPEEYYDVIMEALAVSLKEAESQGNRDQAQKIEEACQAIEAIGTY